MANKPSGSGYLPTIAQEGRDVEVVLVDRRQRGGLCLALLVVCVDADRLGRPYITDRVRPPGFGARLALEGAAGHTAAALEAGGDHGDADVVAHVRVDDRAEDHVHVGVRRLADDRGS